MKPKLSISIPTYGSPEIVVQNVKKILECPYQNIEVNIVDNDETGEQLKNVTNIITDKRFRYHRKAKNIGRRNNIAKAIEIAEANFVLLLSSSDEIYMKPYQAKCP